MLPRTPLSIALSLSILFSPLVSAADEIETSVVTKADAVKEAADWGDAFTYFTGETYGSSAALALVAVIKPGMEIHPPHAHADEEVMMVIEGSGEWHLKGKDFPAKAGDIMFSKPWDMHGIKNTGDTPLKFVVWKWGTKGMAPPKPE